MELHVFRFLDQYQHGRVWLDFLSLRKKVLVDGLGWDIPHGAGVEMDQYDNPTAVYSIVTDEGRVVAGARAAPCSAKWGDWTYMLEDARRGKISAIPGELLFSYPRNKATWECTRFVSVPPSPGADRREDIARRTEYTKLVVAGLCQIAGQGGAKSLVSLSPLALGRLLNSFGYKVSFAGATYKCPDDDRRYRPFQMECDMGINRAMREKYLFVPRDFLPYVKQAETSTAIEYLKVCS